MESTLIHMVQPWIKTALALLVMAWILLEIRWCTQGRYGRKTKKRINRRH